MSSFERREVLKLTGAGTAVAIGVGGTSGDFSSPTFVTENGEEIEATVTSATLTIDGNSLGDPEDNTYDLTAGNEPEIDGILASDESWNSTTIDWPSVSESGDFGSELTLDFWFDGEITGEIARTAGTMTADMPMRMDVEVESLVGDAEGTIIIDAENLTTEQSGEMTGEATGLDTTSATVTLVDNELVIPEADGDEVISEAFNLPSMNEGDNYFQLQMDLTLPELTVEVTGTVTDGTDPIEGATVEFLDGDTVEATATTDQNGEYSLSVPLGTYEFTVDAEGFESYSEEVTIEDDSEQNAELTEEGDPTGTLTGTVTDGEENPLESVDVTLLDDDETVGETQTDESGDYEFEPDPGTYDIEFEKAGFETAVVQDVTVSDGDETVQNVELVEQTGTVSGTVTDGADPLEEVDVISFLDGTIVDIAGTDASGEYEFELAVGTYTLQFEKDGFETKAVDDVEITQDEQTTEDVALTPTDTNPGTLTGTVTDNGSPHDGLTVELHDDGSVETDTTDEDGEYSFEAQAGSYTLVIDDDGEAFAPVKIALTIVGDEVTTQDIQLRAPRPEPVGESETAPQDLTGDSHCEDITGDGEFTIGDVQALFNALQNGDIPSDDAGAFNFSGMSDDEVSIFDVQALFQRL